MPVGPAVGNQRHCINLTTTLLPSLVSLGKCASCYSSYFVSLAVGICARTYISLRLHLLLHPDLHSWLHLSRQLLRSFQPLLARCNCRQCHIRPSLCWCKAWLSCALCWYVANRGKSLAILRAALPNVLSLLAVQSAQSPAQQMLRLLRSGLLAVTALLKGRMLDRTLLTLRRGGHLLASQQPRLRASLVPTERVASKID